VLSKPRLATTREILLYVAPVTLHGPAGDVETSALVDEASTVTLIDASLGEEIGAIGSSAPLTLAWTDAQRQHHPQSQRINIDVSGASGKVQPLCRSQDGGRPAPSERLGIS